MELETIIGLEIHAQLSTKTKLFCNCDNDAFGAEPNTRVCPICMGWPGMLPVINEEGVKKGVRGAAALGCKIQKFSKFDRKNYFYPDLPSGFQISQFDQPISLDGKVLFEIDGEEKIIRITRVHLENDAGKLIHTKFGTLCDYNRAGTPLIEIVTEPDLRSAEEAQVFAKEVQKILRFVNTSYADMEKGMMRFDASVSLRPKGEDKLYPRAEIKNLNSFASLFKAINFEISRQRKLWEVGTPQNEEITVGWLDDKEKTKLLRSKESAMDYRYFPEPDLPPMTFSESDITSIEEDIPELPLAKFHRYQESLGLGEDEARKLAESQQLSAFFEKAESLSGDAKKSANLILSVILADTSWHQTPVTPQHVADTLKLIADGKISSSGSKDILKKAMDVGKAAEELMKELGLEQVSDSAALKKWVTEGIAENSKVVEDYKSGNEKVIQFLMGQVMRKSKGAANPEVVMGMIKDELKKVTI